MAEIRTHRPVMLVVALFSRHDEAFGWAEQRVERAWGPLALKSDLFTFDQTTFYERSMGSDLKKGLFAIERLIDPADLPAIKRLTNDWEEEYRLANAWPEDRPLNLDPGYLTEAKLVLATTKDRDHRLYLSDGIFGEVTLYYHAGAWRARDWTYPDYRQAEYHAFFDRCRNYLRRRYHASSGE